MVVLHQRSDDKKQEWENKDNNKLEITLGHKEKLLKPEEGTCYDKIASGWECTFMKMLCLFSSLFRSDTFYGSHMFANTVPKKMSSLACLNLMPHIHKRVINLIALGAALVIKSCKQKSYEK